MIREWHNTSALKLDVKIKILTILILNKNRTIISLHFKIPYWQTNSNKINRKKHALRDLSILMINENNTELLNEY